MITSSILGQTLTLSTAEYSLLVDNSTEAVTVGGDRNAPAQRRRTITATNQLELRIDLDEIQVPGLPQLNGWTITAITINGRRYTDIIELAQVWNAQFKINQPQLWAQINSTGKSSSAYPITAGSFVSVENRPVRIERYQVKKSNIIVPGTTQTLAESIPPQAQAVTISLPTDIVIPTQPLLDIVTELDLSVVDVDIQGNDLVTTYADSTQRITALPVPPLADFATTSGSAATALVADNLAGGNSTTGLGSLPYQAALNTTALLAPNTTTQRRFLMQQGSGTIGSAPQWASIVSSDIGTFVGDVRGSVFGDDSTLLVDGTGSRIVGPVVTATATVGTLAVTTTATGITASMVGLGNVTNESKATMFASPTFTGTVTTPTGTATHYYRLASSITGISTAQDFFGATDAAVLDADSFYEIEYYVMFSKQATNNTIVFTTVTTTAPQDYTAVVDSYFLSSGTQIAAANMGTLRSTATTNTVTTIPVLSFSPEQSGHARLRVWLRTNASSGGNIRLQASTPSGTCTAVAGSYYRVIKHPSSNSGSFVA